MSDNPARYQDGEPVNLAAASRDALTWLKWSQCNHYLDQDGHSLRCRLRNCIATLETHLALHLPAELATGGETDA